MWQRRAVRKGTPNELRRDLYFHLMDGPRGRMLGMLLGAYFFTNVLFAALYMLAPGSVEGMRQGSFMDAFWFSVQTMTTIGYGVLHPANLYADILVTIEAAIGIFGVALATGLMFAKASRPRASVLFSNKLVITVRHGVPTLVFRVGNARGNDVVEANMMVTVLKEEISPEGHTMRKLHDLKLHRERQPLFALAWTILHTIDESSPPYGVTEENVEEELILLISTLTGYDATYAQQIHARVTYHPDDIRWNHRFVDTISTMDDGRLLVDYTVFHDTVPDG